MAGADRARVAVDLGVCAVFEAKKVSLRGRVGGICLFCVFRGSERGSWMQGMWLHGFQGQENITHRDPAIINGVLKGFLGVDGDRRPFAGAPVNYILWKVDGKVADTILLGKGTILGQI